jgi:dipeptide transport system substrate-binding protein
MKTDSAINLMSQEGLNIGYLAFNTEKAPFTDVKVRQALSMAVNRDAIIEAVYQGAGKKAKNPIPPTIWSYNDKVEDTKYDPEAARKLLADAGFPNGFETDLWAMPVQRPYNPNARRMAEMVQADWAKIGVKVKIVSYEWGEYLRRTKDGEHQTMLMGWTGDNGDPDNFLYVLLGCEAVGSANRARFCYQPFNDLLIKAKRTPDVAERTKFYEEAQVVFKEQAPWLTVAHSVVYEPIRKEVKNYKIDPFGGHIFYGVDIN